MSEKKNVLMPPDVSRSSSFAGHVIRVDWSESSFRLFVDLSVGWEEVDTIRRVTGRRRDRGVFARTKKKERKG